MAKKKILLINPAFPESLWGFTRIHSLVGIQYGFLPLALPTLAALTPDQFELQLIDECVEPIDFDTPCDVVALTAFNVQSQRAFESCTHFKPGAGELRWVARSPPALLRCAVPTRTSFFLAKAKRFGRSSYRISPTDSLKTSTWPGKKPI